MDATPRTEALRLAKTLIGSHGVVAHMNKYNRDMLAREVTHDSLGLRYEFQLDPTRNSWSEENPSCTLNVVYNSDPKGSRIALDGAMVVDNTLRVSVSASGNNMDLEVLRRRESMVSMLGMLAEMLTVTLPPTITLTLETPEAVADNARRVLEQKVGQQIFNNLHANALTSPLKGLRVGGASRSFRLTNAYTSDDGKYPASGTYRFRHVRLTDRRGRPKDTVYYSIRVTGNDDTVPPVVSVRRVLEPK